LPYTPHCAKIIPDKHNPTALGKRQPGQLERLVGQHSTTTQLTHRQDQSQVRTEQLGTLILTMENQKGNTATARSKSDKKRILVYH